MSTGLLATIALAASLLAAAFGLLWLRARRSTPSDAGTHGEPHAHGEAEPDVARLRAELERAAVARESFFDLVTHELHSPLAAILGYQELLADGAYGDIGPAAEPVDRIGRSARHLLHLIDGVVELSRIRAGSVRPDLETVDLRVVMSTTADTFRTAAEERRIEPRIRTTDSLPTIRSDPERLVRALDLVITSAVKHSAEPVIHLDITADDHGASLRIHPTLIETRSDAEDPAVRLGLRLAVARGIAHVLGGSLDLETDEHGLVHSLAFQIRHQDGP